MGLILDSSVLIAAERQGKNARQVLTAIRENIGETLTPFPHLGRDVNRVGARSRSREWSADTFPLTREPLNPPTWD
jgi:hypothetical protein